MRPEQFGNYTLFRQLGKGGMAEVFLARARSIEGFEKLVAIKRLLPPFNTDSQIISMLADEARLSVWLTHPHIVQVLDFGKVGKTYYLAMEYVEGCDLCDLIRPHSKNRGRPLPLPTALYVVLRMAEALDFAHNRCNADGQQLGIIHRDVSPHNVLISIEGQVKLTDFGLARAKISAHRSFAGVVRGKFSYMPKEQAHGREIDHRIDLFAAGVTLYESLTGVKPFTSTSLPQQLYQLEQPIPPPSAHVPDIPEDIDDLTLQCMSPEPEQRYQTAEALAQDLRDALLKVSTFAQEEKQLSALVKHGLATLGQAPGTDALPRMDLTDLPVTSDNIIGSEVREVQRTQLRRKEAEERLAEEAPTSGAPLTSATDPLRARDQHADVAPDSIPPPPLDSSSPHDGTDDEEDEDSGKTYEYPPRPSPADGSPGETPLDNERTIARPPTHNGRATAPSPAARAAEPIASPAGRGPRAGGPPPRESLDDARTILRSPDDALRAFQRALEEREHERRHHRTTYTRRHRFGWWAGLVCAGMLLFALGLAMGLNLRRPASKREASTSPLTCPRPPRCPACRPDARPDAGLRSQPLTAALPARPDAGSRPDVVPAHAPRQPKHPSASPRVPAGARPAAAERPAAARPAAAERPPAASAKGGGGVGYLSIKADHPAKAYIDDRQSAASVPVERLPLPAGVHTVRVLFLETKTFSGTRRVPIQSGKTADVSFTREQ